jgi:soluble lytic murein transglycosylase-like protein
MRFAFIVTAVLLVALTPVCQAQDERDPELIALLREAAKEVGGFADHFDAQVWLTDMSARLERQVKDPEERIEILKRVHHEAQRAELRPELVLAVIDVESNFDRFAISVAGARGLMQIMPFWLAEIGRPDDNLMQIETNLRFGYTILKYYIEIEKGNLPRALGRYNGSLGKRKYPNKVLDKLRLKWFRA